MKEYIEREALLNSFEELMNIACEQGSPRIGKAMRTGTCAGIAFCRNEVRHAPAADVVEVVRCKDCKYYAAMITDTVSGDMETVPWGICAQPWFNSDEYDVQENGYCSYGERRMDKEE